MVAVIIEDERLSAERLLTMIDHLPNKIDVAATLESLKEAKAWFRDNSLPDMVFLDIQLGDGTAFDLMDDISVAVPIIFTTAYDNYAIKAFKFNSIDYLLKPIEQNKLEHAVDKLFEISRQPDDIFEKGKIDQLHRIINGDFKKRFLVKRGDQFIPVNVDQVAYFVYHQNTTWIITKDNQKFIVDQSLDQLENMVSPLEFYRVNRQMIITLSTISEIHSYFNSRLLIKLEPACQDEVIVARDRVAEFKRWMDL